MSPPYEQACGGARPSLFECARGLYFAECGSAEGAPAFACDDGGCLWFAGGCVAQGYREPDCPVEELCCHATPDGLWPWADWAPSGAAEIAEAIAIVGAQPITRSGPSTVDVSVDASLPAPSSPTYACEGGASLTLCGTREGPVVLFVGTSLTLRFGTRSLGGDELIVEVVPQSDGGYVGRAYLAPVVDVGGTGARLTCEPVGNPRFLQGPSTLVLDRVDGASSADVHGRFDLALDGVRVIGEF